MTARSRGLRTCRGTEGIVADSRSGRIRRRRKRNKRSPRRSTRTDAGTSLRRLRASDFVEMWINLYAELLRSGAPHRRRRAQNLLPRHRQHRPPPRRRTQQPHPRLETSTECVRRRLPRPSPRHPQLNSSHKVLDNPCVHGPAGNEHGHETNQGGRQLPLPATSVLQRLVRHVADNTDLRATC